MIETRDIRLRYGERVILNGVSLQVDQRECVGLLGASGSGKSTLLRIIAGEQHAEAGLTRVDSWRPGSPQDHHGPPAGLFGVVYQDPVASLDALWRIRDCIEEPLVALGIRNKDERAQRVALTLSRVRLGHLDPSTRVSRLSVGQAQRVAMARALVAQPTAILADEPTSALDPTTAATIVRLLREAADGGAAVLTVSHNPTLLASYCDRIFELADGQLQPAVGVDLRSINPTATTGDSSACAVQP